MQFEEFDDRIRQAADQHHPDYDERAWARMEKLLDRELPQKDDRRRRFIFLLFLFLLVGGGLWLFTGRPGANTGGASSGASGRANASPDAQQPGDRSGERRGINSAGQGPDAPVKENMPGTSGFKDHTASAASPYRAGNVLPGNTGLRRTVGMGTARISKQQRLMKLPSDGIMKRGKPTGGEKKKSNSEDRDLQVAIGADITANAKSADTRSPRPGTASENAIVPGQTTPAGQAETLPGEMGAAIQKDSAVSERQQTPAPKAAKKKAAGRKSYFSFSISLGPDLSYVGLSDPGKIKLATGAGVSYTIRDRWALRTGFYTASKVYEAAPGDYKPADPVLYPDYLRKIYADCKVYEIPLLVSYGFGRTARSGLFISSGLSSLIMKKENYLYRYEYPSGTSYSYSHNVDNKYRHYFSILSLSAGYQRRISRSLSLVAEPYVKMPLSGVGYGKIKLNGAGILFSLQFSPFNTEGK